MTPWMLGFAAVCFILCYGLLRRPRWMWYAGWAVIYFVATGFGQFFYSALLLASDAAGVAYAWVYFVGGLLQWLVFALFWAGVNDQFGAGSSGVMERGAERQ